MCETTPTTKVILWGKEALLWLEKHVESMIPLYICYWWLLRLACIESSIKLKRSIRKKTNRSRCFLVWQTLNSMFIATQPLLAISNNWAKAKSTTAEGTIYQNVHCSKGWRTEAHSASFARSHYCFMAHSCKYCWKYSYKKHWHAHYNWWLCRKWWAVVGCTGQTSGFKYRYSRINIVLGDLSFTC